MSNPRLPVGEAEIVALVDAAPPPVAPSWSFPGVPADRWSEQAEGSLDAHGCFRPNLGCFLVRTGGIRVLVDASIGPGPNAYLGGATGRLPERLAEEGLSFADIDMVVFTHLHMDHVGWAARPDGAPAFSGATYVVAGDELTFWLGPATGAGAHHLAAIETSIRPLARSGRIETAGRDGDLGHGLALLPTPGHTPGHRSLLVSAGGETAVIAGDVFHCPAQVAEPAWSHRADMDMATAARTRRRFIDEAARSGWAVAAGHFRDGQTFGAIVRGKTSARWRPAGNRS